MNVSIDHERARKILHEAANLARTNELPDLPSEIFDGISEIISHTHRTYKYILVNALLARATNADANPLALQAGADLDGAFDARSLCHKVLVPFEQTELEKRLGGSNEPFLNKPARFTHLSEENPVRGGKDKRTLRCLIRVLERVAETGTANASLISALNLVLKLKSRSVRLSEPKRSNWISKADLSELFRLLMERSCNGETCVVCAAVAFELMYSRNANSVVVESHITNQSGASSREVSDIDIFESDGKTLRHCLEVKDKPFTAADVDHAVGKVIEASFDSLIFLFGPNSSPAPIAEPIIERWRRRGFDLSILDLESFIEVAIATTTEVNWEKLLDCFNRHLELIRAKQSTISYFRSVLESMYRDDDPIYRSQDVTL